MMFFKILFGEIGWIVGLFNDRTILRGGICFLRKKVLNFILVMLILNYLLKWSFKK